MIFLLTIIFPVKKRNVTDLYGEITSPGYPEYMEQAHYVWTFRPLHPQARIAVFFQSINLFRFSTGFVLMDYLNTNCLNS